MRQLLRQICSTLLSPLGILALSICVSLILYAPYFGNTALVLVDDEVLVTRMKSISSFTDYLSALKSGWILDRQPLRDLSYWVDWQIFFTTGLWTFKLTNWLLWVGCIVIFWRILKQMRFKTTALLGSILFVILHPVTPIGITWLGGRKHILALFFILLATLFWIETASRSTKSLWRPMFAYLFWVASLFAHPIFILWPAWSLLVHRPNRNFTVTLSILASSIIFAVGYLNVSYYQSPQFIEFFGQAKIATESWLTVFYRLVVLGRAPIHIVFPFFPNFWPWDLSDPVFMWPGFLCGIASCSLLIISLMSLLKNKSRWSWKSPSSYLLLMYLPLAPVTIFFTHESGYDSYLLLGVVVFPLLFLSIRNFRQSALFSGWAQRLLFGVFSISQLSVSLAQVQGWNDRFSMAERMVEIRRRPFPLMVHARNVLIPKQHLDLAFESAVEAYKQDPNEANLGEVLAISILQNQNLKENQKRERILSFSPGSIDYYYLALAHFRKTEDNPSFQEIMDRLCSRSFRRTIKAKISNLEMYSFLLESHNKERIPDEECLNKFVY